MVCGCKRHKNTCQAIQSSTNAFWFGWALADCKWKSFYSWCYLTLPPICILQHSICIPLFCYLCTSVRDGCRHAFALLLLAHLLRSEWCLDKLDLGHQWPCLENCGTRRWMILTTVNLIVMLWNFPGPATWIIVVAAVCTVIAIAGFVIFLVYKYRRNPDRYGRHTLLINNDNDAEFDDPDPPMLTGWCAAAAFIPLWTTFGTTFG